MAAAEAARYFFLKHPAHRGDRANGRCAVRPFSASHSGALWSMIPKSGYRFSEKIMLHQ
jgi:hypothetical protein